MLKPISFSTFVNTVWKFNNFPTIQILREIKLSDLKNQKLSFMTILEALNFKKWPNIKLIKIDFTKNMRGSQIPKFSHCGKETRKK